MNRLFTIQQASEILNEDEYRIRYWSSKFQKFLSDGAISKKRAYTHKDIEILSEIIYLNKHKDLSTLEIRDYIVAKTDNSIIDTLKTDDLLIDKYDNNDNIPLPFNRLKHIALTTNIPTYRAKSDIISIFKYFKKLNTKKEKRNKKG